MDRSPVFRFKRKESRAPEPLSYLHSDNNDHKAWSADRCTSLFLVASNTSTILRFTSLSEGILLKDDASFGWSSRNPLFSPVSTSDWISSERIYLRWWTEGHSILFAPVGELRAEHKILLSLLHKRNFIHLPTVRGFLYTKIGDDAPRMDVRHTSVDNLQPSKLSIALHSRRWCLSIWTFPCNNQAHT